jgi:DNA-binding response OmpR family regulator
LRNEARTARIPIVILSSREAAGDRFWGLEAGADAYISKGSFDPADLPALARRLA